MHVICRQQNAKEAATAGQGSHLHFPELALDLPEVTSLGSQTATLDVAEDRQNYRTILGR